MIPCFLTFNQTDETYLFVHSRLAFGFALAEGDVETVGGTGFAEGFGVLEPAGNVFARRLLPFCLGGELCEGCFVQRHAGCYRVAEKVIAGGSAPYTVHSPVHVERDIASHSCGLNVY